MKLYIIIGLLIFINEIKSDTYQSCPLNYWETSLPYARNSNIRDSPWPISDETWYSFIFNVGPNMALKDCLQLPIYNESYLIKESIASLLNSLNPYINYSLSFCDVYQYVNNAYSNNLFIEYYEL